MSRANIVTECEILMEKAKSDKDWGLYNELERERDAILDKASEEEEFFTKLTRNPTSL